MTKEELLIQLEHTRNNYIMGLAALSIFDSGKAVPLLEYHAAAFGPYSVTFDQVAILLRSETDHPILISEFNKMLMRTTIKESFEHIKDYCQDSEQYEAFKSQQWYEFARIIRNFLSHNCRFIFNKYDRERLPISYKDFEITEDMHNGGLGEMVFGNVETWELFNEMEGFVKENIT
jgi:hypothetical protein